MDNEFDLTETKRELIIELIKEEMKSYKLISGLHKLGLSTTYYHSNLSEVILSLIGFAKEDRDDNLYALYDEKMEGITGIEKDQFSSQLSDLAQELYEGLINEAIYSFSHTLTHNHTEHPADEQARPFSNTPEVFQQQSLATNQSLQAFFIPVHTAWILEYILSKKEFHILNASETGEDYLQIYRQGQPITDRLLVGIFNARETALVFCKNFQSRLLPQSTPLNQVAGLPLSYKQVCLLIREEFEQKPYGFLKKFCHENNITYQTMISLIKGNLTYKVPLFVFHILRVLNYQVRMSRMIEYLDEGTKGFKTEVIYCFLEESSIGEEGRIYQ